MKSRIQTPAPSWGWCQTGRVLIVTGKPPCPNRAAPGLMLCSSCREARMAQRPDRAIGDRAGIRLGYASVMSRSWE